MPDSTKRIATRWLLLSALFLGVVAMHHVTTTSAGTASAHGVMAASAHHSHSPEHPSHDTLHLCLAVLGAAVSVLLVMWLLTRTRRTGDDRRRPGSAWARAPDHPPPVDLLSSLCVLRL